MLVPHEHLSPKNRVSDVKILVLTASDHNVHVVVEWDDQKLDIPISPSSAEALATTLIAASMMVKGDKSGSGSIPLAPGPVTTG